MTEDSLLPFDLPAVKRNKVTTDFAGGSNSSDGGLVLLRAAERRLGMAEALAGCIQRDQGRYHDRQRADLVVARQRGDLVAERLSRAGGQDPERMPSRHRLLDDGPLHGPAVVVRRFGTKAVIAEPAFQLLARVMELPAPAAGRIGAGGVPEAAHQLAGLRKLVAHLWRHHRITARHRQPCQGIGQRPSERHRTRNDLACLGCAGGILQPPSDRRPGLRLRRPAGLPKPEEEPVQGAVHAHRLGGT